MKSWIYAIVLYISQYTIITIFAYTFTQKNKGLKFYFFGYNRLSLEQYP